MITKSIIYCQIRDFLNKFDAKLIYADSDCMFVKYEVLERIRVKFDEIRIENADLKEKLRDKEKSFYRLEDRYDEMLLLENLNNLELTSKIEEIIHQNANLLEQNKELSKSLKESEEKFTKFKENWNDAYYTDDYLEN